MAIGGGIAVFQTSYPSGTAPAPAKAGAAGAGATGDIVDIRVPLPSGAFTARAGDALSVRELFGSPMADLMRVAIRGEGGGQLILRGADVTGRSDFDPLDYNELLFVAGAHGSAQDLVAVPRKGTRDEFGTWRNIADGAPVQVTARVTGLRSVETAAALRTEPAADDAEADMVAVARDAAVFAPFGTRRAPVLSTVGNVTLKAGDAVALRDLFTTGKGGAEAALFRLALRDDAAAPGARLLLEGADVTHRLDFTPEEFNGLQLVVGATGGAPALLVVARAGTRDENGAWRNVVDSPATSITAAVTGLRSANAAPALRGDGDADDAAFLLLAQEAAIFAPLGGRKAPTVTSAGDLTAKAGDAFSLRDLFPAAGAVEAALYRVALRDDPRGPSGGRLLLDGVDVTGRTDFSQVEFVGLQYVAGPEGGAQDILVVARAGTPDGAGGLAGIADSPPATIRAEVTGVRSLNAAEALRTPVDPAAPDADFMMVAGEAALFAPLGSQVAPTLLTGGNFTAAAGDRYALRDLFTSPFTTALEVTGYRVALREADVSSGARLLLDGEDATRRVGFTAAEFNALQFVAGSAGATELLVVARTARPDGTGTVDSRAVAVTASVTGERSINALPALRDADPGDAFARLAADAAVYAPLGGRVAPTLSAVGDFTAAAGDRFSMNTLFDTGGAAYAEGAAYRVAMRDDAGGPGGGRLLLDGVAVTGRTEFSGPEFAALLFEAGPGGGAQDLLVVPRRVEGGLITDGAAVEITARVTGLRSVNAMAALRSEDAAEGGFDRIVRDAAVYAGSAAPKLSAVPRPEAPLLSAGALAAAVGAYRASRSAASGALELDALFGGVVGASRTAGAASARLAQLSQLVALLGGGAVGGVRTAGVDLSRLTAMSLRGR